MSLDLARRFHRCPLAFLPSPIHRLERLSRELGIEVWAKRDDVSSGLAYGGNKVRKLEFLASDALAQGCDTLVSIGGVQSNHTRQVAAVAARLEGMITDPVYEGKSMAGLIGLARSGEIPRGARVLYVHLGGAPALDAYHRAFG